MRSLQWHLKTHWSPESDPPDLPVPQSQEVEEDLLLVDGEGSPSHEDAFRDACTGPSPVFGRFLVGVGRTPPRSVGVRVWSVQESSLHINLLEMKA